MTRVEGVGRPLSGRKPRAAPDPQRTFGGQRWPAPFSLVAFLNRTRPSRGWARTATDGRWRLHYVRGVPEELGEINLGSRASALIRSSADALNHLDLCTHGVIRSKVTNERCRTEWVQPILHHPYRHAGTVSDHGHRPMSAVWLDRRRTERSFRTMADDRVAINAVSPGRRC